MDVSGLITREERRKQLNELRRRLLEEDWRKAEVLGAGQQVGQIQPGDESHESGEGVQQSTAGPRKNDWQDLEQLHDQVAAQDDATSHNRSQWSAQQVDDALGEEAELQTDAEKLSRKLGVQDKVVNPNLNLASAMLAAKEGEKSSRTRVTGKTGTGKGGRRKLLHPGSLIPQKVDETGKLGVQATVLPRPTGYGQTGFAVIG